ncbi:MAG: hypothetical protein U1A77_10140 [Pirellulales bacterium]
MSNQLVSPAVAGFLEAVQASEARGDASNFKGTDYHVLYALWLLLCGEVREIYFYAGNDLLAKPAAPPSPESAVATTVALHSSGSNDEDVWTQLKCTAAPWTCSELFNGNLLSNFVCNSLISEECGRRWKVRLVTTAEIRSESIRDFVAKPSKHPDLNHKLSKVVRSIGKLLKSTNSASKLKASTIRKRVLEVLQQITACQPTHREVLAAQITCVLVSAVSDQQLAKDIERLLLGAILQNTALGKPTACRYDRQWIREVSGHEFGRSWPLFESAQLGCDAQVNSALPPNFDVVQAVERREAMALLTEFLSSSSTLFVLSGRSGTGKSWVLSDFARRGLGGQIRVWLTGLHFSEHSTLQSCVASALRAVASPAMTDPVLLRKFVAAGNSRFGPPLLILDDLKPSAERPRDFARAVGRLVDDARNAGVKVLISCQSDLIQNLHPFRDVGSDCFFRREQQGPVNDTTPSYAIGEFSDDELKAALYRRLKPEVAESLYLRVQDPAYAAIRNPYHLGSVLSATTADQASVIDALSTALVTILDRRISMKLDEVARYSSLSASDLNEIMSSVVDTLWVGRTRTITRLELRRQLEQKYGDLGPLALDTLGSCGVLSPESNVTFSEAPFGARLTAKFLHATTGSTNDLVAQLRGDTDHDVVVQLIATASDPVSLAAKLTDHNNEWIAAAAEGLQYADPGDRRAVALLVALARREESWTSADTLGRFSLRSKVARRALTRRFVSHNSDDRQLGQRAFWTIAALAPERSIRAADTRIRLERRRLKSLMSSSARDGELVNIRNETAQALGVLGNIDSRHAAEKVLRFLPKCESLTGDSNRRLREDRFSFFCSDPVVESFDEVQALACAYANHNRFQSIIAGLESEDEVSRIRAVHALHLVAHHMPEAVEQSIIKRLSAETSPAHLSGLLWSAYRIAERAPADVLKALAANTSRIWATYETAATSLSLLETIGESRPLDIESLLPGDFPDFSREGRALLAELVVACQSRCGRLSEVVSEPSGGSNDDHAAKQLAEFHLVRAAAAREMLTAGRDLGIKDIPQVWRTALEGGFVFFALGLSGWMTKHGSTIRTHCLKSSIIENLVAAINSESKNQPHVLDKWRLNLRFIQARDCADSLVYLLESLQESSRIVARLPGDWQRLYCVRKLLDQGSRDSALVDLALEECESHRQSATPQASADRTDCLITLRRIVPDRIPAIEAERHGISWFFSGGRSAGSRLAAQFDEDPALALQTLESSVAHGSDAILLEAWHIDARRWPSVLISEAYSAMFRFGPLSRSRIETLVEQVCSGLEGLPKSEKQEEYLRLYKELRAALAGQPARDVRLGPVADHPLAHSHRVAAEILRRRESCMSREEVRQLLWDRRGWHEFHEYKWDDDGTIGHGSGVNHFLLVFFPAVRFALYALGQNCGWTDPAFSWMKERRSAVLLMKDVMSFSRRRGKDIDRLKGLSHELADQEVLHSALGQALLEEGRLEESLIALNKALASPLCVGGERGNVLYNLACYFARVGDADGCRERLVEMQDYRPLDVEHMKTDTDLDPVRQCSWFAELVG